MANPLKFSVIIPYRVLDHYVRHCVEACRELRTPNFSFELILLPDTITTESDLPQEGLTVHPTGPVFPSAKRNQGAHLAKAEYCAFIDSDAYPLPDWLLNARDLLEKHPRVGCLGGPNHIPPGSPLLQCIGTRILYCRLGTGAFPERKLEKDYNEVMEMASSNLIVRTALLRELGGMDTGLLTAEDALLCFQIREAGHIVAYAPNVEVFHHRRNFPWPYLRSIHRYGRDKAWILKERLTIDKYYYFAPTFLVLGLFLGGLAAWLLPALRPLYAAVCLLYAAAILLQSIAFKNPPEILLGIVGIPATHVAYGIGFMTGLITTKGKNNA